MKIVVVAGAFNPLTSADITFFDESAKHGKYLIEKKLKALTYTVG